MLIFDVSTLILLARIELLEIFLTGWPMEVLIPKEVERESCGAKGSLDALLIRRVLDESRIRVVAVENQRLVTKLEGDFGLGKGEAEAIALALVAKAKLVGIDDKNGINACKLLGMAFTTAPAILIGCRKSNQVTLEEALVKLELLDKQGRYKKAIIEDVRSRLEDGK